jgi:hypothetical protein
MQVNGIVRICGVCCESSFKTIDEPNCVGVLDGLLVTTSSMEGVGGGI